MDAVEDLSPEEQKIFNKLPQEAPSNPALENIIINQLRKEGLIHENSSKVKLTLRWAAIFILSFGFFLLGSFYESRIKSKKDFTYVFLLRNSESLEDNAKGRFKEYQEWREGVEQSGILITGEKLSAPIATLGAAEEFTSPVSGFFMLSSKSDDEALKLASESPHVKNGGSIEVRRIVHQ